MSALSDLLKKKPPVPTKSSGSALSQLLKTKTQPKGFVGPVQTAQQFRVATLPPWLGGGAYNIGDDINKIINTGHTTYGGVKSQAGKNRDDIVPVSLGGNNQDSRNIKIVDAKKNPAQFETEIAAKVKRGEMSLAQGRLAVMTYKQQQAQPLKTTTKGNFLKALEETLIAPVKALSEGLIRGEQALAKSALNTTPGQQFTDYLAKKLSPTPTRVEKAVNKALYTDKAPTITEYGKEILPKFAEKGPIPFIVGAGLIALDFTGAGGSKNTIKALTATKDISIATNILKKIGVADDLIKEYAPIIAKTSQEAEVSKIVTRIEELQKTTSITKIVPESQAIRTTQNPTIKLKQSQLATENLARTATKREPLRPINIKPVSYADSITKPIISKQAVTEALNQFEINDGGINKILSELKPKAIKNPALVKGAESLKDISGFKGQARDVYRNFKAFFGEKFPEVKKQILDPFDAAKGKYVDTQKTILSDLKTNIVNKLGISKGSKESAAVMDFGEKLISKDDLVKKFGTEKANKIVEADAWFRQKYDSFLEEVNASRKEIYPNSPEKIIPKRQDYYRHFQELGGLGGLKNIFETPAGIDPTLAGISAFTKPKSKYLSFAQKRLGLQSARDAVGGFLEYVPSYAYAKHIDPEIGKFRTLAKDLALQTQESKNANNFIEYLGDFANDLAGKTNAADRFVQKIIPGGRKTFGVINWLNQRVKANTILGNASSSIAQIFNVPQGIASAKQYSIPGVTRTMGSIFAENKPMLESSFIKERYSQSMFNTFEESLLAKPKQFAAWMVGVTDELGTKFIWNSHYAKALAKNIENPVKYADDITRNLVAGRGIGEVPLLQKSKVFQLFAPFQLEVGNLWYVMGDQVKAKDFSGLATLLVSNFLFNRVAEKVRGSDVVFDPINAVYEGLVALNQEEDKKVGSAKLAGRVAGELLSNVPGGQTLASMYPEYGFKDLGSVTREDLFGKGDPTRFGSGLLIKGVQDPLFKVLPSFGGGQLKKTIQGTKAFIKGKVENKAGKKQFDIPKTPDNLVRSVLFGKYSSPQATTYFDKQAKPKSKAVKKEPTPKKPKGFSY